MDFLRLREILIWKVGDIMMISPELFKEHNKDKTLKELVIVRNQLLDSIKAYENRKILNKSDELTPDDLVKPSPETRYNLNNQYLKEITELIEIKFREKN